jgi:L-seryl-tRNA(Ser) seleniumtransferase
MSRDSITRRAALKTGAGAAVLGAMAPTVLAGEPPVVVGSATQAPGLYEVLGINPVINAAGTITNWGGSLMPPEVTAAWQEASRHFVDLRTLQDRVGERIAERLGVEAALVTSGAAGGIMLGTAAAVTYKDHDLIRQLPLPPDRGLEVIRQASHVDCYDNQVKASGVSLVDVETRDDLERAINDRTVMMLSYNFLDEEGRISREEWVEVAQAHGIPTLIDAAADTPPRERLWDYVNMGYDMVIFSGGKAMRGPQDTGLLLGRRDLIETAKLNTSPRCWNIGRGMKVSKEDMVAMWATVERFMSLDMDAQDREWRGRIDSISDALRHIPTTTFETVMPLIANEVPHLLIRWDEEQLGVTPGQMKAALAEGDPSIVTARIHGTGEGGFVISVFMLEPGEDAIIANRLLQILEGVSA